MNKKYIVLAAGFIEFLAIGIIYGWNVFRVQLVIVFPQWTAFQSSLPFMLSITCFVLGGLLAGILAKRLAARMVIRISALLFLLGLTLVSTLLSPDSSARSLVTFCVCYGGVCGLAAGLGCIAVFRAVLPWFPRRKAIVCIAFFTGLVAGALLTRIIFPGLLSLFEIRYTFIILGAMIAAVLLNASVLMVPPDES